MASLKKVKYILYMLCLRYSEACKWKCLEAFRYANLDLTLGGGVCVCVYVCVEGGGVWTQRPLEPFLLSPEENWSLPPLHTSLFCIDFSHGICNFLKTNLSHSISLGVHWGHEKVLVLCMNHSFLLTRWMGFLKEVKHNWKKKRLFKIRTY